MMSVPLTAVETAVPNGGSNIMLDVTWNVALFAVDKPCHVLAWKTQALLYGKDVEL